MLACADRAENDGDVDARGTAALGDEAASPYWPFDDPSATRFAIVLDGAVIGMVQYGEEEEPAYRHAR